ncbi:MAG: hypothetical protein VB108_05375 [Anaerolineaceae bacterium]|nr:hypothetical protein [Anaerolineaceae bacterium]
MATQDFFGGIRAWLDGRKLVLLELETRSKQTAVLSSKSFIAAPLTHA